MSDHKTVHTVVPELNGARSAEHASQIKLLQDECDRLRDALARTESERDLYRKALYEQMRGSFQFQDVTIAELEKMSAGPVEFAD